MEPLRWTPYMDDAIRILNEEKETELDILLTTQAKCHVIAYQITRPSAEWTTEHQSSRAPPAYFIKAMQIQLQEIQQSLPAEIQESQLCASPYIFES
jgi:hypothetical protein